MLAALLLAVLQQQQPAAPAPASPIAKVEVTPATGEIQVGQTLPLKARALDSAGQEVPGATIRWFAGGDGGGVDSVGVVIGAYRGTAHVTAVASVDGSKPTLGTAVIKIAAQAASRIEIDPVAPRVVAGTRLTLTGTAYSAQNDRRDDILTFKSSNPRVASVTADGRLAAVAPGSVTITANAGTASATTALRVIPNTVMRVVVSPSGKTVRTGDVLDLTADPKTAAGRGVDDVAVRWAIEGSGGVAQVDSRGAFVAETPGKYTVTATVGTQTGDVVIEVVPRAVGRGMEVVGRLPTTLRLAEFWVHPNGKCGYLSTIADRVYAIDISTPSAPKIVDSMVTNSRIVNDVMTTEDGSYGVFSREGASDRKNGIVIFEASNPCHPRVIAEYTATVSGGVHSSYVYKGYVFLTDDATGSMRVIDIHRPTEPKEVARWQTEQTEEGRYLHDIAISDGLAYLSYWNDGLVILDVGNGMRGGSPEKPTLVSQYKYNLDQTYARVDQLYGLGARGTHTAWRAGKYVFVGDEVYASKPAKGLVDGNNLTFGRLHVIDVSDIAKPKEVAWYEPTDGGVHNVWVAGDTLYLGNYQGGARALDISGELKGDLLRQGREISWILTADSVGARPRATFAWGAVVRDGNIYVPDINTGLWVLRLEPKQAAAVP